MTAKNEDKNEDKPILPRPIENPNYEKIRAKIVKRFAKTLAYLASH